MGRDRSQSILSSGSSLPVLLTILLPRVRYSKSKNSRNQKSSNKQIEHTTPHPPDKPAPSQILYQFSGKCSDKIFNSFQYYAWIVPGVRRSNCRIGSSSAVSNSHTYWWCDHIWVKQIHKVSDFLSDHSGGVVSMRVLG